MDTSIISEMNTNYLLISSAGGRAAGFEEKMFEYNDIKGFLSFQTGRVNNNITYQYKIADSDSMAKAFYNKEFTSQDVKNIFTSIAAACRRAYEYLLDVDAILLNPEFIFINGEEYMFCYYPAADTKFNKGLRELMEYILERLDHSDGESVMRAYGLYRKILKNNFTMDTLMEEFGFDEKEERVQIKYDAEPEKTEPGDDSKIISFNVPQKEADSIEELEKELENVHKGKIKKLFHFWGADKKKKEVPESKGTMLLAENNPYNHTQLLSGKVLVNQGNGRDIILNNLPIRIGSKKEESDFCVDNIMVSRSHAVLTYECGNYYVEDNDSTNGTFVNGSRIAPYEPVQIKDGDTVSFANEKYRLNLKLN